MSMLQALIAAKMAGGSGGGSATEKTLAQRGFITHPTSIDSLGGTAPDYYISVSQTVIGTGVDVQSYVPEAGSLLIVRAPYGVVGNATLKFRVGSQYSASWPIYYGTAAITSDVVKSKEVMLLSYNGSRYYVAGVVRDPVTVPTKLSDLQNDLDMSAYTEIIPVTLGTGGEAKFAAMLNYAKGAITASSGEKSVMFLGNFQSLVSTVLNLVNQNKLPVVQLDNNNRIVVTEIGVQGAETEDAVAWYAGSYHEAANVDGTFYTFSHEIAVATGFAMIHTKKYPLEVVTS